MLYLHVNLRPMHILRHVWGWGVECRNVDVNLRHVHMLRHVLGGVCGVLTFMLTCVTCTCYVTSWVAGVGCVDVHVNLRHTHMLRHVLGWVGGGC